MRPIVKHALQTHGCGDINSLIPTMAENPTNITDAHRQISTLGDALNDATATERQQIENDLKAATDAASASHDALISEIDQQIVEAKKPKPLSYVEELMRTSALKAARNSGHKLPDTATMEEIQAAMTGKRTTR